MKKKVKILIVFGTRPEVIKVAPVIRIMQQSENVELYLCNTGQHKEMILPLFDLFKFLPDFTLNTMVAGQGLTSLTTRLITSLDEIIRSLNPEWVLAQGDTATVMCASLAAYYNQVKFGHIEAGLRTNDKYQPFPEEINRRIAGVIADLHFAPTNVAVENLLVENINPKTIILTGNTIVDAINLIIPDEKKILNLFSEIPFEKRIILVTAHRRENIGEPFNNICRALKELAISHDDIHVVFPVHYNPNFRNISYQYLGNEKNISLLEPMDYEALSYFMSKAYLVLTDSGGIQEEGASYNKPILVLRNTTERPEGIEAGISKLIGTSKRKIIDEVSLLLNDRDVYLSMTGHKNPYGDGKASERILNTILKYDN